MISNAANSPVDTEVRRGNNADAPAREPSDPAAEVQVSADVAPQAGGETEPSASDPPDDMIQLIDVDGNLRHDPVYSPLVADIGPEQLRVLYSDMALLRAADAQATALQRQGELGLWPSCLGQEGAQIGAGHATRRQDYMVPTYREHGIALARGIDPVTLLEIFRGISHCGWDPKEINFHPYTIVLGAQTLHAVGYAMGQQRDRVVGTGDPEVDSATVTFFGDGATSEGEVSEALTFAATTDAPVVFFCQNNQWAISVPTSVQTRVPLYKRAGGWGIPSVRVDGNDVLASLAVTREAGDRARSGGGPSYIEAYTYRLAPHTTSDDPTRYRTSEEEEAWRLRDPLLRVEKYLRSTGAADDSFFADLEEKADALARSLAAAIRDMADPDPSSMFAHAYAESHPIVEDEMAWFTEYHASFEEEAS